MRILGLDPSITATGFAVVDGFGRCLYSGTFKPANPKATQRTRVYEIAYKVRRFLEEGDVDVTHIAMEEPPLHGTPTICQALNRLNGAISMAIYTATFGRVPVVDLRVDEWRTALGFVAPKRTRGDKKANEKLKAALMLFAKRRWPESPFASNDAAEAALIAARGLAHFTGEKVVA